MSIGIVMAATERYRIVALDLGDYTSLIAGYRHPLYFAPWWLEVVLPIGQGVCFACYDEDRCLAIFVARLVGRQLITPSFCQYTGVLFLDEELTPYERQSITQAFHHKLPRHTYYHLSYSPSYSDWLGLYWLGYEQTTRYNYLWSVSGFASQQDIRQAMSASQRKNLKATERAGFVFLPTVSVDEVGRILASTASYKGYKSDLPLMLRLIEAGLERGTALVVGVADAMGQLAMVAFWVEHQGVAYLIGEGTDRAVSGKYQLKLFMLMHYIDMMGKRITHIDFEGSMLEPIAKIYQALGAMQQGYMTITRGQRYHPRVLWHRLLAMWSDT